MLLAECVRGGGVEIVLNARGIEVEGAAGGGFLVACSQGEFVAGRSLWLPGDCRFPSWGQRVGDISWRGSSG